MKEDLQKLKDNEERFRVLFEASHDLISLTDEKAKPLITNPAWQNIFGDPEKYGEDPLKTIHPDDIGKVTKAWQDLIGGKGEIENLVYRYQVGKNQYRSFETTALPVKIGGKKLYYTIAHDITLRRQLEDELKKKLAKVEELEEANKRRYAKMMEQQMEIIELKKELEK